MDPDHERLLKETYRLSLENNKILRKMRRGQLWSNIISWVIWGALLIAPIWFYMTYLSGTVDRILAATGVVQKSQQTDQSQMEQLKEAWQQFQSRFEDHGTTSQQQ
jgi:hypothetical protein